MWMRFVGGELERDRWVLCHSLAYFAVGGLANHECGEDSVYPKQLARKAYSKQFVWSAVAYSKIVASTTLYLSQLELFEMANPGSAVK